MGESDRSVNPEHGELAQLLPAHFRDGRVAAAVYTLPIEAAREAVRPPQLHPVSFPGGRALAVLCTFEYLDSTIGAYTEWALGIVVRPRSQSGPFSTLDLFSGHPNTGAWILSMPVTSERARQYGVELFGYPKTLENIDVDRSSKVCTTVVHHQEQSVLTSRLVLGRGPKFPVPWLVTYTQLGDAILRTRIKTNWWVTLSRGEGAIDYAPSEHPIARELGRLQLSPSPIFVLHGSRFRAILPAGERV